MSTFLFHDTVFGPIKSRRLGISLGINLLPTNTKFCNYNCIYCECGWNPEAGPKVILPKEEEVIQLLEDKLISMQEEGVTPDVMTFAGNGEPTLHPAFPSIMRKSIILRDTYFPSCRIAVLSNATRAAKAEIREALLLADDPILKFDSASDELYQLINQPAGNLHSEELFNILSLFNGQFIMQSLFLKGTFKGKPFNNGEGFALSQWLDAVAALKPEKVMVYSLDRATPHDDLQKFTHDELAVIAKKVNELGIETSIA
jgi:wyosine [tRNA(Phe)-imidazoG37] synthetase (radical SAM superfamily)